MSKKLTAEQARHNALESKRKYYYKNRGKALAYAKGYYQQNKDKLLEQSKGWRDSHPEKVKEYNKKIYSKIGPHINDEIKVWLKSQIN